MVSIYHFCFILFWSPLCYFTTHLKPKEGFKGRWLFSTAINIMDLGIFGICWLLLAMCPLFAFLKKGWEWWLHVPFEINFPEPKTQYTWLLLQWCFLRPPAPAPAPDKNGLPQTPDLAKILPKWVSEESKNLCKSWSKKRKASQLDAHTSNALPPSTRPSLSPQGGREILGSISSAPAEGPFITRLY